MPTIQLMTWNLNNREAALYALVHEVSGWAGAGETFIVAVQECADAADDIRQLARDEFSANIHAVGNGGMSVLCSEPLDALVVVPADPVELRFLLTRARIGGRWVVIMNYHGEAGLAGALTDEERGGLASEARWRLEEFMAAVPERDDHVVILGDFNAEPTSAEIESGYCWCLKVGDDEGDRSHGRLRRPVKVVVPEGEGSLLDKPRRRKNRWKKIDFFAVDAGLDAEAEIKAVVGGEALRDGERLLVSDHLPVAGTLTLP